MARKLIVMTTLVVASLLAILESGRAATTVTVTDMVGRKLTIPAEIKRVVPLAAAARYLVYMQCLDLVAGMEAIETKWTTAGRPYGLVTYARAGELPVIGEGGPGRLPDFEKIIEVWPDLILAMGIDPAQVDNIQQKTGIPVFMLSYGPLASIDMSMIKQAFRTLGQLLGREERATKLISYMNSMKNDLTARIAPIDQQSRARAYVGAVSYMGLQPITSTESHFEPLAWAGGMNVADEIGKAGHYFIDPEQLLVWNPGNIFIDAGGLSKVAEGYQKDPDFFQRLNAVQEDRVFLIMPYNYYYTNIEIALANTWFIGKALYPQRFEDIDAAAKADEIFKFFLGIPAYTSLQKEYHGFGRVRFNSEGVTIH